VNEVRMPSTPRPSPQADGSPESLHKTQPPDRDIAKERVPKPGSRDSDEHLGAEEDQVSDTSAPAGSAFKDEPKQG
jgi:hypothetical protein